MRLSRVLMVVFALASTVCVVASCGGGGDGGGSSGGGGGGPVLPSGIAVFEGVGTGGPVVNNEDAAANGRDFGGQDIGAGPTTALTITIRNTGTGPLALGTPSMTGASTQFVLNTASFSTTVAPSTNTSFTIAFDPTTVGTKNATVRIVNDAANEATPFEFDITGVAVNGSLPAIMPDIDITGPMPVGESDSTASAVFSITLSAATSLTVTVDYDTVDGTATAPSDYTTKSGTVTFTPGQTSKTVSVAVIGDTTIEADEDFDVDLSNASNGNITTATATAIIADDDTPDPAPTFAADIQPIFDSRCINCHPSNGGLNLTSYANLMSGNSDNGPVIVAGNAANSLLVKRIEGTIAPRMPKNGSALSAQQIQKIKTWINNGALNN